MHRNKRAPLERGAWSGRRVRRGYGAPRPWGSGRRQQSAHLQRPRDRSRRLSRSTRTPRCHLGIRVLHPRTQSSWGTADTRCRLEARPRGGSPRACFRGVGPASSSPRPATWRTWTRCSVSCYTGQCGLPGCGRAGHRGRVRLGAGLPSWSRC